MRTLFKIISPIAGGILGIGKKKKPVVQQLPQVSRDDAVAQIADDELLRRRGGAADILNGTTGADAALSGGKLVVGS